MLSDLTFDPFFKVNEVQPSKGPETHLLLVPEAWDVKPCAANLLMLSDLTFHPSFKVKQGLTICKGPRTHLLLVLEAWAVEFNNFPLSNIYFYKKKMCDIFRTCVQTSILSHGLIF